jgi:hypothetical protein
MSLSGGAKAGSCRTVVPLLAVVAGRIHRERDTLSSPLRGSSYLSVKLRGHTSQAIVALLAISGTPIVRRTAKDTWPGSNLLPTRCEGQR